MRDFVRKPFNLFFTGFIILSIVVLVVVLLGQAKQQQQLPSYELPSTETTEPQVNKLDIEYHTINNQAVGYTMTVPAEWQIVDGDNAVSVINQMDKTTISIETMNYFGSINNDSEESINMYVQSGDGTLYSFAKLSNSDYTCSYDYGDCFYAEYFTWDLDTIIKVSCICTSDLTDKYLDTFSYMLDTFHWEKKNPIPDGYYMMYSDNGHFEFAAPADWTAAIDSNGIWTAVSNNGSTIQCNLHDYDGDLSEVTESNYAELAGIGNAEEFELTFFQNEGNICMAEGTYYIGSTQYCIATTLLINNGFMYEFNFGCTSDNYDDMNYYITSIKLFRIL